MTASHQADSPVVVPSPDSIPAVAESIHDKGFGATSSGPLSARELAAFGFVVIMSLGWGFNWPVVKYLLSEWPPISARGLTGLVGAIFLAVLACAWRQPLSVPREFWPKLLVLSVLNVTIWLTCIGLSLLWLSAGETALVTATMPIWVSLIALPVLGERFSAMRVVALVIALSALGFLFGADSLAISMGKLPGIALAVFGTVMVSLGTVLTKKSPLPLPPLSVAAWQIGIGCIPMALFGLIHEHPDPAALSTLGWSALAYVVVVQFGICYATFFAALERLPASTTSIAMLSIPVIGVVSSAVLLGEPLGLPQIVAMVLTLGAVVLAVRS
jgi:probable blue pigment (indigoidine) exporter